MTKQQALNTINNIIESQGYRETNGDAWLGPRLEQLREYIQGPVPDVDKQRAAKLQAHQEFADRVKQGPRY